MASNLRYLLVLDFEATCGESGFPKHEMEIIEFPTIVYDLQEKKEVGRFHEYVKPVLRPQLTEFCTELTGITQVSRFPPARHSRLLIRIPRAQETVDNAEPFPPVWERFKTFIKNNNLWEDPSTYAFVTCGAWDLHTMLPQQLSQITSTNPSAESDDVLLSTHFRRRVINIKTAFQAKYGYKHGKGMAKMLGALRMDLVGRHHSGIDDCGNILRIAERMVDDGWVPEVKPEVSR